IETPEGPNIGLISSMSTFARINEFGFIETPYRKVEKGRVTDEIEYLTADREENFLVAQANAPVDGRGHFTGEKVSVRYRGDFLEVDPSKVNYMDVSPKQLVSVAAGLIPFLEHDDANRSRKWDSRLRTSQIHALKCRHVREPEADCAQRSAREARPGDRRRPKHRSWRACARTQCARRVHALERIQLRRCHHDFRKGGEGRCLHFHSHRRVRDWRARHQAWTGGNYAGHSQCK